jgi:hypothetical protein
MGTTSVIRVLLCTLISVFVGINASAQEPGAPSTSTGSASEEGAGQQDLAELNRQLQNPVSSVWSLTFQFNNFFLNGKPSDKTRVQDVLNFQPVLPLHLTKDLNLIIRPVLPFIFTSPVFIPEKGFEQKGGFGDMALIPFLSPARSGNWILGAGPTFIFPTASKEELGQGKFQLGPAAVVGWFNSKWMAGVFPQQAWSVAGDDDRPETSQANIQYFVFRFLPNAWLVGMAPNVLINWEADNDNKVTFPVGASVGKTVKIGKVPVNFRIEGQWMAWHPDDFGQRWNIQLVIKPVIPSLIPGTLF